MFLDTGMIVSANTFRKEYGDTISKDCEAVLTYMGDNYIQSLKSGEWMALIDGKKVKDKKKRKNRRRKAMEKCRIKTQSQCVVL